MLVSYLDWHVLILTPLQIKWQGKAHYHATWEPWTELTSVRGFRRLENYYRKTVEAEQFLAQDPDVAPEEREKYTLDRETYLDALDDYMAGSTT